MTAWRSALRSATRRRRARAPRTRGGGPRRACALPRRAGTPNRRARGRACARARRRGPSASARRARAAEPAPRRDARRSAPPCTSALAQQRAQPRPRAAQPVRPPAATASSRGCEWRSAKASHARSRRRTRATPARSSATRGRKRIAAPASASASDTDSGGEDDVEGVGQLHRPHGRGSAGPGQQQRPGQQRERDGEQLERHLGRPRGRRIAGLPARELRTWVESVRCARLAKTANAAASKRLAAQPLGRGEVRRENGECAPGEREPEVGVEPARRRARGCTRRR